MEPFFDANVLDTIVAQIDISRFIFFHHGSVISSVQLACLCPNCVKMLQSRVMHADLVKSGLLTVELVNYGYAMILTSQFKFKYQIVLDTLPRTEINWLGNF